MHPFNTPIGQVQQPNCATQQKHNSITTAGNKKYLPAKEKEYLQKMKLPFQKEHYPFGIKY
jgi:hypothetical protein